MKRRHRIYYSAVQRSEIWDRWQAGESMSSIGRRFDRESSSVFSLISPTGGIRPPVRHRAKKALTLSEREEISRWLSLPLGTICIDRLPRGQPQWRSGPLPGCRVRSGRLGSSSAPEALQAGLPPVLEADSIDWAATTMVAGTNSWLAQAHISGGATKSGVTRDDLSQPVHPGARRAEKRAA
jgi:hypothetical protein